MNIIETDTALLLAINDLHTPFLDRIMWDASCKLTWLPLYAILIAAIILRYRSYFIQFNTQTKRKEKKTILRIPFWIFILVGFGIAVGLSDFVSSGILKPIVCRLRPTHDPYIGNLIHIVNDYRGGEYGFPSSHAANTFAVATLFALVFRIGKKVNHPILWNIGITLLFLWASLNCYSRMYLGVHYPLDIICGALLGSIFATLTFFLLNLLATRIAHD